MIRNLFVLLMHVIKKLMFDLTVIFLSQRQISENRSLKVRVNNLNAISQDMRLVEGQVVEIKPILTSETATCQW